MITIPIPWWALAAFYAKKAFFLFFTPLLVGFLVSVLYPLGQRMAAQHRAFFAVMLSAGMGPAAMLLGWSLVIRTLWTAPLYGLGYGLGVACLSRVHKVRLWPPRIVTRRMPAAAPTS
jgi:hypothetical protein